MPVAMWPWVTYTGGEWSLFSLEYGKVQSEIADRVTNSFKTGRYLGAEGDQVHETRMLHLPN